MSGPDGRLELRRLLPGSLDEVFAAWTEPERISEWMTPVGTAVAEVDLRVGGSFRVVMAGDGVRIEHTGEYLEIDPPRKLRFTWRSPYTGPAPSVVTVELTEHTDGTELHLVHEQLPAEAVASHGSGWGSMLDRLMRSLPAATEQR